MSVHDFILPRNYRVAQKLISSRKEKKLNNKITLPLGTLSNDDDGGRENVAKKMNLRSLKLNRVYLARFNVSNTGDFPWSLIHKDFIQVQKEEGKFLD